MNEQLYEPLAGLIAAAGPGTRLYPESKRKSKVLLTVDGKPLISRIVSIMAHDMGIKTVFVITGKNHDAVQAELGCGEGFGIRIQYIQNPEPEKGLAQGVLLAEPYIKSPFCLMLSDELYQESSHSRLPDCLNMDFSAVCCVKKGASPGEIKKNYAVDITDGRIVSVQEKPDHVKGDILGCGTFLFKTDIFDAIRTIHPSPKSGRKELVDAVHHQICQGKTVIPFFTEGDYVNVNTADDLNHANYLVRGKQFNQKTVSLVIPSFNEKDSIVHVINDFKNIVDEIIVADNRSSDGTAKMAAEAGAIVYSMSYRGYGQAIRCGIEKVTGDIIVVTEADGSFKARDLGKLLEYLKDADMVIGTRTTRQMIEQGANMPLILRLGNVVVAKIIEILWWNRHEPRLTDVGCTYRAIWRDAYDRIKDDLTEDGPAFSPEMIIEPIRHFMRIIEIPVSYHGRIGGDSKHSGNFKATVKTGLSMLALIITKRIRYFIIDDVWGWVKDFKAFIQKRWVVKP